MQRVALVTGAGSGIGRAASLALIQAGFAVCLVGRREDRLRETAAMAGDGAAALVVPADVTDENAVARAFAAAVERYGRLDVLFNNAGTGAPPTPIDELSLSTWNTVIGGNLTGAFLCARAAFRQMKQQAPQGGRIINNGSISAHAPRPLSTPYTASKHAITGLTRSLALDGRAYNIACAQIDIGNAATAMTAQMQVGMLQANGEIAAEATMDVAHVAEAVVFIAKLPLEANVQAMTILATRMPFAGRG